VCERADQLRGLVGEQLGALVSFRIREHTDPMAHLAEGAARGGRPAPSEPMPPEVLEVVKRMQAAAHEQSILAGCFEYYNRARCTSSLVGDAPEPRPVQGAALGRVVELPEVGGLHHRYERAAADAVVEAEGKGDGPWSCTRRPGAPDCECMTSTPPPHR